MAVDLVLSPLISCLVKKAAGSLIEQFCRVHGMEDDRKKLQRQLLAIHEKIVHAEKREANSPLAQSWLKELRAVAYEALDVLDEFPDETLQQKSSVFNKVKSLLSVENPGLLRRFSISRRLKNTLDKIDEIVTEMSKFNFELCEPDCTVDRPLTCSFVNEAEVIGRDCEKEEIVNELLDLQCQSADHPVIVLPIVGMAGLGKTTLVQLVYNDKRVKQCFQLLIWVCVSHEFNVVNIIKSIIEVATNGEGISTSNIEVLQSRLRGILSEKKYLLVLDDVSIEQVEKWDFLKDFLFSGDCSGSVVIVTTCSKSVASMVETIPSYHLTPLGEGDSWELFQRRAFRDGTEGLPELVEIGRTIVRNCGGLPRALKEIGTLLSSTQEEDEWHAIAEDSWDYLVSEKEISLGIPAAEKFNSSLSLLLRHQIFKQPRLTKHKCSYYSMTANFILNNSIYKWHRRNGFDSSEPHISSSLHPDIDIILRRLSSSDPEAQHSAAGAIRLLTRNIRNGLFVARAGAVPLLNNLLSSHDSHIQEYAVTALLNLSVCDENKARMVASGSTRLIVHTLTTGNTEARENSAAILFCLSVIDEYKELIGAACAIPALVSLLIEGRPLGKKDAITALLNLCLIQGNKRRAVRTRLIPILMCLLTDQAGLITNEAVVLMAILASHPGGRVAIREAEAVPTLVEIVKSGFPRIRENAAELLLMLFRGKGGQMYIHQAAECGLHGPLRDMAETGTDRGKGQAFLLKNLMNRYSCSGLKQYMVDKAEELTEKMALMTMLQRPPEGTVETGTVLALIIKGGSLRNREDKATLLLEVLNREGRKMILHPDVKFVIFDSISDLAANCTDVEKEKATLLEQLMIRYFRGSLNLVD